MEKMIYRDEIISVLKADKNFLKDNYGVLAIGLFGSYVKDQQTIDSDIDLLVEFIEPRFDWLASLQCYMEEKFNKKVEIVRKKNIDGSSFLKRIEKDVVYA